MGGTVKYWIERRGFPPTVQKHATRSIRDAEFSRRSIDTTLKCRSPARTNREDSDGKICPVKDIQQQPKDVKNFL